MARKNSPNGILVVGLGRFGSAVAVTLEKMDREVLVVESSSRKVNQWQGRIPLIQADATQMAALEQLGARDFDTAVVGIGSSLEASVLVTANLVDLGLPQIWAKATSREHGRILKRIGAHHVVYPEYDAGQRTAHLVGGQMLDYIEMDRRGFSVVKMRPPAETHGFTLGELDLPARYGIQVIGVLSPGHPFEYAKADTRIDPDSLLIVSGDTELLEQFANRSAKPYRRS
ncbi:MAG: TrkA family potassium uptake protein [Actinomycetaceae bacterium]|nr:TrkA family potassium uptake protein [Actinomycetaceae bacterium]